jgi:hypothetical protein
MKKTKTIEYLICDFKHKGEDVEAVGKVQPSGKDACAQHFKAYTEEIRLPDEFGNEMSGRRVSVDPGYDAKMVIEYKKEKK